MRRAAGHSLGFRRGVGSSGGGGGSVSYAALGVEPILVGDRSRGIYGFGAGGATAPTLLTEGVDDLTRFWQFYVGLGANDELAVEAETYIPNIGVSSPGSLTYVAFATTPATLQTSEVSLVEINTGSGSYLRVDCWNQSGTARMYPATRGGFTFGGGSANGFTGIATSTAYKLATRYRHSTLGDSRMALNGTLGTAFTAPMADVVTRNMCIDARSNGAGSISFGWGGTHQFFALFNQAFTDAELQQLTDGTYAPV